MNASEHQVGGSHYTNLAMQPVQITYLLGATPLWMNVCKYLSRDKHDDREDTEKALHCIALENEMYEQRCSKYVAEVIRFDHPEIEGYSSQFEDKEFINSVLQAMYFGFYQEATNTVKERLDEEFF